MQAQKKLALCAHFATMCTYLTQTGQHMIELVSIKDAGYYNDEHTSGNTVKVTLKRENEYASCDGILIWNEADMNNDLFDEWADFAQAGIEGYEHWQAA